MSSVLAWSDAGPDGDLGEHGRDVRDLLPSIGRAGRAHGAQHLLQVAQEGIDKRAAVACSAGRQVEAAGLGELGDDAVVAVLLAGAIDGIGKREALREALVGRSAAPQRAEGGESSGKVPATHVRKIP